MACPWDPGLRRRLWLRDSCDVAFGLTDVRRICRLPGGLVRVVTAGDMDTSERRLFRLKLGEQRKKRLSLAKSPLPKIQPDQEAAGYFESHSVAGVWDQLAEPLRPSRRPRWPGRSATGTPVQSLRFHCAWPPNRSPRRNTSRLRSP